MVKLRRIVGWIIGILVLLLVLGLVIGVYAYATDYPVEATVTKKECVTPYTVFVHTKQFGMDKDVAVSQSQCAIISVGNFVEYHLRSGRTTIYDSESSHKCLYDSEGKCGYNSMGHILP